MEFMIWVVTIALVGLVGYAIFTEPPSSGCLSADAAAARDRATKRRVRSTAVVSDEASAPAIPELGVEKSLDDKAETPVPVAVAAPDMLRNPLTGETAAVPTNYRFAKKWIKEALVTEGLLDRIYGNRDLDAAAGAKVKAALIAFRALEKYRG